MIPGRGYWRGVYSAMVDHPDFQALSPNARLTLFICRLGSLNNQASIFRYYMEPLAAQTGLSLHALGDALTELETKPSISEPWIVRDDLILWVRNGLKHDPNVRPQLNDNHKRAVLKAVSALPRTSTVKKFNRYYKLGDTIPHPIPHPIGDTIPHPIPHGGGDQESSRKGKEEERKNLSLRPVTHVTGSNGTERPTPTADQRAEHYAKQARARELLKQAGLTSPEEPWQAIEQHPEPSV
jgi:hypothetical protein